MSPCIYIYMSPNQESPHVFKMLIRIPRTLHKKLHKRAVERKMRFRDFILEIFIRETINIELTEEEYEEIAKAIREAEQKSKKNC